MMSLDGLVMVKLVAFAFRRSIIVDGKYEAEIEVGKLQQDAGDNIHTNGEAADDD
jgi:hypothetical protein